MTIELAIGFAAGIAVSAALGLVRRLAEKRRKQREESEINIPHDWGQGD